MGIIIRKQFLHHLDVKDMVFKVSIDRSKEIKNRTSL
mgnify:CR=1 FL=1